MTRLCVSGVPGTAGDTNPQRTCGEVGRMTRLSACNLTVAMSLQRTSLAGEDNFWPDPLPTTFFTAAVDSASHLLDIYITRGVGLRGR